MDADSTTSRLVMTASPGYTPLAYGPFTSLRPQSAIRSSHIVVAIPRPADSPYCHSYHRPFGVLLLLVFSSERPRSLSSFPTVAAMAARDMRNAICDWQCPAGCCYDHSVHHAPLAQLAEQQTLNLRVRGSSPWRRTRSDPGLCPFRDPS